LEKKQEPHFPRWHFHRLCACVFTPRLEWCRLILTENRDRMLQRIIGRMRKRTIGGTVWLRGLIACCLFVRSMAAGSQDLSRGGQTAASTFTVPSPGGEAVLEVTASTDADWSVEGRESAVLEVLVNGKPRTDLILFIGPDRSHSYRALVGHVAEGKHEVTLRFSGEKSPAQTRRVRILNLSFTPISPNDPRYPIYHSMRLICTGGPKAIAPTSRCSSTRNRGRRRRKLISNTRSFSATRIRVAMRTAWRICSPNGDIRATSSSSMVCVWTARADPLERLFRTASIAPRGSAVRGFSAITRNCGSSRATVCLATAGPCSTRPARA